MVNAVQMLSSAHITSQHKASTKVNGVDYADMEKWFMKEVQYEDTITWAEDALTWAQFKGKLEDIAAEHEYVATEKDWKMLKLAFEHADFDDDGTITTADFSNSME